MAARRRQRLYARDSTGGIGQGLARQYARPHQGVVHSARRLPPLADRPNHQALPAPHVTAGKDLVHAGGVTEGIRRDIAARIERHPRLIEQTGLYWPDKSDRKSTRLNSSH